MKPTEEQIQAAADKQIEKMLDQYFFGLLSTTMLEDADLQSQYERLDKGLCYLETIQSFLKGKLQ